MFLKFDQLSVIILLPNQFHNSRYIYWRLGLWVHQVEFKELYEPVLSILMMISFKNCLRRDKVLMVLNHTKFLENHWILPEKYLVQHTFSIHLKPLPLISKTITQHFSIPFLSILLYNQDLQEAILGWHTTIILQALELILHEI